ncbi:MAG: hypothetical protein KAR38_17580, partial [Calditrichia bacterium]|nr:hypothetical protein [Calditrichia bacterium]
MKKVFAIYRLFLIIVTILSSSALFANIIYVDQTLSSNCTSGNYSIENRNCSGTDGDAYNTLQDVLWGTNGSNPAISIGDTVYLREGVYQETYGSATSQGAAMQISYLRNGTAWTPGNFNLISTYPGDDGFAIIDGSGDDYYFGIGYGGLSWDSGNGALKYWQFENLEIRNGSSAGIGVKKGPIRVRYCYIHDNGKGPHGDGNRGGIHAMRLENSLIEYNYFYNNSGNSDNNKTHIIIYADYLYNNFDINNCNKNNEIRYNLFNGAEQTYLGYKDKASQNLGSYSDNGLMTDMTNKDQGSKIHHNIFLNVRTAIMGRQYFQQIYNNILVGGKICGEDGGNFYPIFRICVYNNTMIGNYINNTIGYNRSEANLDLAWVCVNNIVENFGYADYSPSIGIAVNWSRTCTRNYTWTNTLVNNNFLHNPQSSSRHYGLPDSYTCKTERWLNTAEFNSEFSVTNYTNSSTGLWKGATGADQYKTNGGFVLNGSSTISNGGIGSEHPF